MKINLEIASVPDREGLVVELWRDNYLLAEVSKCEIRKEYVLEIYSSTEGGKLIVDLDVFSLALSKAKIILAEMNE
ncbi:hypothetical protein [Xanthomonas arboricola]|uniref:hypothetical protein n=1 Tax=Xanthomonas arboricola TaxID=56448 RepID=UPI000E1E790B|nr:hypothetical protein [Xanthomonas arboricola]